MQTSLPSAGTIASTCVLAGARMTLLADAYLGCSALVLSPPARGLSFEIERRLALPGIAEPRREFGDPAPFRRRRLRTGAEAGGGDAQPGGGAGVTGVLLAVGELRSDPPSCVATVDWLAATPS